MSDLACVKCGSDQGWGGPRYEHLGYSMGYGAIGEALVYSCRVCGFRRQEPTKDAKPYRKPPQGIDVTELRSPPPFPPNRVIRESEMPTPRCAPQSQPAPWWAFWR